MADKNDAYGWDEEDAYWTANYRNRPYASSNPQDYGYYRPGYRFTAMKRRAATRDGSGRTSSRTSLDRGTPTSIAGRPRGNR